MKKLNLNKYTFLDWMEGEEKVWISNEENYLKEIDNFSILKEVDLYRYKRIRAKKFKEKLSDFDTPGEILDGLEFGEHVKDHYTQKYPNLKSIDLEGIFDKKYGDLQKRNFSLWKERYIEETRRIVSDEDNFILFEGWFEYSGYSKKYKNPFGLKPDVLIKSAGLFFLIEAKASKWVKKKYIYDLYYQWVTLGKIGIKIKKENLKLALINNSPDIYLNSNEVKSNLLPKDYVKEYGEVISNLRKEINFINKNNSIYEEEKFVEMKRPKKISESMEEINFWVNKNFSDFNFILEEIVEIQLSNKFVSYFKKNNEFEKKVNLLNTRSWRVFGGENKYEKYFFQKLNIKKDYESIFSLTAPFNFSSKLKHWFLKDIKNAKFVSNKYLVSKSSLSEINEIDDSFSNINSENEEEFTSAIVDSKFWNLLHKYLIYQGGKKYLNSGLIKKELEKYSCPIYMYDFETFTTAAPRIKNTIPYQQIPFQFSIHVILDKNDFDWETGKNIKHLEWISNNRENLFKNFWENFGNQINKYGKGTYVSFNKSFELTRFKEIIKFSIPFSKNYLKSTSNIYKLLIEVINKNVSNSDLQEIINRGEKQFLEDLKLVLIKNSSFIYSNKILSLDELFFKYLKLGKIILKGDYGYIKILIKEFLKLSNQDEKYKLINYSSRIIFFDCRDQDIFDNSTKEFKVLFDVYKNTIDLADIFKNRYFYDLKFKNSYSIKTLAPYFVEELDYSKLNNIKKGDMASLEAKYFFMNKITGNDLRWKQMQKDMLKYCEYDTLSMVAIFQNLIKNI